MNTTIDPLLLEEVLPLLETGESLLWASRPHPFWFARARIVQAFFGALFCLPFALAYLYGFADPGPSFNASSMHFLLHPAVIATGILFTLTVVCLPVLAYRSALRTVFAATDRRVLSIIRGSSDRSMRYDDIQAPFIDLTAAGVGDIRFQGKLPADGRERPPRPLHFLGVRDAENIHRLILKRLPGFDDGKTAYGEVQDYLELLAQGKRTLDDEHRSE